MSDRTLYERIRAHLIEKTVVQYAGENVEEIARQHIDALLEDFELEPEPKPVLPIPKHIYGHGHVFPREDGQRARCGGPGLCIDCNNDYFKAVREGHDVSHTAMAQRPKG